MGAQDVIGLYERHALEWVGERSRQTKFIERGWLDRFAALADPGGSILDLGCGPAKPMAAYLIQQGFRLCGVDLSPTMVALARTSFPEHHWIVADMRKLPLQRRFSAIMAWDSFFHLSFDDQQRMFTVFLDHAVPGAPLLFTSGPQHGEAVGTFGGEALYHASLAPNEYRSILAANGFAVIAATMNDPDCGGHSVWLARDIERRMDNPP